MTNKYSSQSGAVMTTAIIMMVVMSVFILTAVSVINLNMSAVIRNEKSQQAFNIAEAGVNYYLWHLAHNAGDLKDGHSGDSPINDPNSQYNGYYGPYTHTYYSGDLKNFGTYTLYIKPKSDGSSVAIVKSIGKSNTNTSYTRTIEAEIGGPSWSRFGLAANVPLWFGADNNTQETSDGPVFSSIGIRMDGPSNSDVVAAQATYGGYAHLGAGNPSNPGVWCSNSIKNPDCATRDKSLWVYPPKAVNAPDFTNLTVDLCELKKLSFSYHSSTQGLLSNNNPCLDTPTTATNPAYIPRYASTYNSTRGYLIELNSDGTTYNLRKVSGESYSSNSTKSYTQALTYNGNSTTVAIPSNKVIFVEDNVWVRTNPKFNGKVTIVAGRLASSSQTAKVIIADNLAYANKTDGSNSIGLISEGYIEVAPYAPSNQNSGAFNLEINGALVAADTTNGYVRVPSNYLNNQSLPKWTNPNQTLTFYGSIVMAGSNANTSYWTWSYTDGEGYGYNSTTYDDSLYYDPPPSFPVTGSYNILKWREILVKP